MPRDKIYHWKLIMMVAGMPKKIIWSTLICLTALCTGCATNDQTKVSLGGNGQAEKSKSDTAMDDTKNNESKKDGEVASAQEKFKEIYSKYSDEIPKAEMPQPPVVVDKQFVENNGAVIEQYHRTHAPRPQHHTHLVQTGCADTKIIYNPQSFRNKPIKHRKTRLQPAKSNAQLRTFFINRLHTTAENRYKLLHPDSRTRLGFAGNRTRSSAALFNRSRLTTIIPAHPCIPSFSVLANNGSSKVIGGLPRTGSKSQFNQMIAQAAFKHQVDEKLVHAVIQTESAYNANATSPAGAVGLMQLMPGTAKQYGVTNRHDPNQNIDGGTRYLRYLLNLFNSKMELAVAAYNAGEHTVMKYNNSIPPYPETRNYVRQVLSLYNR